MSFFYLFLDRKTIKRAGTFYGTATMAAVQTLPISALEGKRFTVRASPSIKRGFPDNILWKPERSYRKKKNPGMDFSVKNKVSNHRTVARAQGCESSWLRGPRQTRFGHSLLKKSKGREERGGDMRKEFIYVRPALGVSQRLSPKCRRHFQVHIRQMRDTGRVHPCR